MALCRPRMLLLPRRLRRRHARWAQVVRAPAVAAAWAPLPCPAERLPPLLLPMLLRQPSWLPPRVAGQGLVLQQGWDSGLVLGLAQRLEPAAMRLRMVWRSCLAVAVEVLRAAFQRPCWCCPTVRSWT